MACLGKHTATAACGTLLLALFADFVLTTAASANIATLDQLVQQIQTGSNKKVGFLGQANYDSVHSKLPANVEAVICDGTPHHGVTCDGKGDLISFIKDETLLAGMISGLPEAVEAPLLNTFSSTVIQTHAMLMAPAQSSDVPHGTTSAALSSYDLSLAVDAAIVALQKDGRDEAIRLTNMPFEFMAVHTCKGSDLSAFPVPNVGAATGLLSTVLTTKVLKIGAWGPFDWGGNDGNYKLTPPAGFWPDYLTEFCAKFNELSGPDGTKYNAAGTITCQRVEQENVTAVFADLFDGVSHVTEPYFLLDSFYQGTGETCTTAADCRVASTAKISTGQEQCTSGECTHPKSARKNHFRISCTTIGADSTFMTKRRDTPAVGTAASDEGGLAAGVVVAIVLLAIGMVIVGVFLCIVIRKEKNGKPFFNPLVDGGSSTPGGTPQPYGNAA